MSAYVVGKETIDVVVWLIARGKGSHREPIVRGQFVGIFQDPSNVDEPNLTYEDVIGRKLWEMNVESVHQRYPGSKDGDYPGPDGLTLAIVRGYTFKSPVLHPTVRLVQPGMPFAPPTLVEAYKAIRCLLYQSCEGDVDETKLFKELDAVSNKLAHEIVCALPEYERAETWR